MTFETQLTEILHREIPLSRFMGVSVSNSQSRSLTLTAPLEPNINHKATAFGGSLYSLAVLAGWGLVYRLLTEQTLTGHIVIYKSEIQYIEPVTDALNAVAVLPDDADINRFITSLQKKGRGRVKLAVTLRQSNRIAARFVGQYVVHN